MYRNGESSVMTQRRSVTNPRGHCKLPIVPCAYEVYYHFLVTSSFETTGAPGSIMAACLRTVKQNQASFLKNSSLVYVHCVSKDDFPIGLAHFSCVKPICREIHLSFIDKMNERRVALVPVVVDGTRIDEIFEDVKSPALIRILSSCDTEVRKSFLWTVFIYQRLSKVGCASIRVVVVYIVCCPQIL